jgi:hypothetical protein
MKVDAVKARRLGPSGRIPECINNLRTPLTGREKEVLSV